MSKEDLPGARATRRPGRPATSRAVSTENDRRNPVQERSRRSVERILQATAELLEERGTDAITTDLIAERASVNVATLYQYFGNKQVIFVALFRRQLEERMVWLEPLLVAIDDGADWRAVLADCYRNVARVRRTQPGNLTLRMAMRASPQLRQVDDEYSKQGARALAPRFVSRGGLSPTQARLGARLVAETSSALMDYWNTVPARDQKALLDEIIAAIGTLLEGYLEPA